MPFQSMPLGRKQYEHPYEGAKFKVGDAVTYHCVSKDAKVAALNGTVCVVGWVYHPDQPGIDQQYPYDLYWPFNDWRKEYANMVAKESEITKAEV